MTVVAVLASAWKVQNLPEMGRLRLVRYQEPESEPRQELGCSQFLQALPQVD